MARRISVEILGDSSGLQKAFRRSSESGKHWERDLGRISRGATVATIGFRGLGRSVAFASGAFVGAAGIAVGIKDAIQGAENLVKAQDSVTTALERTGGNVKALLPVYQATAKSAAQFGISQADALGGLAKATALTGNAASAFRAYEEALVISKATHISFDSALTATSKAQEGITTSLRRYGVLVDKSTSGTKQFQIVMGRFGGQARANTSDLDRLRAHAANLTAQLGGPLLKAAEFIARGLDTALSGVSRFADRLGQAHTFHAKLRVVWDGVESVGRDLIRAFERIDWHRIERAITVQVQDLAAALRRVDFSQTGRLVGRALGRALSRIGDALGRVDWSNVGKAIVDGIGAAVIFTAHALPGILDGLGRLAAKVLVASFHVLTGAAGEIGRAILKGLEAGFEAGVRGLERLALKAALAIVEPFSHLPGFLGGGPFQRMKAVFQAKLDAMDKSAAKTARSIAASFSVASQSAAEIAAGRAGQVADRAGPSAPAQSRDKTKLHDLITQQTKNATNLATNTVAKGFVLPFRLQLAQARAGATAAASDDIKVAEEIRAFILKAIPHLHGQKLIDAYSQLGQVNQQIAGAVQQAAQVGKQFAVPVQLQVADAQAQALGQSETSILRQMRAAAERALRSGKLSADGQISAWNEIATVNQELKSAAQALAQRGRDFTEPIRLQIADARAQALGISDTSILVKMKRAAEKALRSGKLSAQGQIDAWNEIASVNQQLASSAQSALGQFKQLNTRKLSEGLGLTPEQRKALRARLSQIGPGGTVPGQGVGAFGFVINPRTDRPIVVEHTTNLDGRPIEHSVTKYQQQRRRRNPSQRRGPNAGMAFGM